MTTNTPTSTMLSAPHVERDRGEDAEHDELSHGRREHPATSRHAIEPPHEHRKRERVWVLGEQLVGVAEQHRRRGEHGGDAKSQQATRPRRTMPWTNTSHAQKQATSTSLSRS